MRHDEKITVYVSSDELLPWSRPASPCGRSTGSLWTADASSGRRSSLIMADLAERGEESELVQALTEQ